MRNRKLYDKRYRESAKGKATQKRYQKTEKGKITRRKAVHRHRQTEKGKIAHCQESLRYYIRHPRRGKAISAVQYAIKTGKLPRPNTKQCYYCPNQAKEYHHHRGYAKRYWLDVVSVCKECHTKTRKIA